jgi:ABC-2 type transport system ATP-binding protein
MEGRMRPAISLDKVVKVFGEHRAVDGLSFDVPEGAVFGLLGRNGAGKTTTIRMIMDIIRPDSGHVTVLGESMNEAVKDRVGYLPEERGLYPKMKVLELLEFKGSIKGLNLADARKKASRWLDRLELGNWKDSKVQDLSKGMQQKVQFIAAVLSKPDLLILDEPFSGMDPVNQDLFKDLLLEANQAGATIVLSTHVMDSAEKLCQEIALIDDGHAVLNGSLEAIKGKFGQNSLVVEFEGDGSFLRGLPGVEKVNQHVRYVEIEMAPGTDAQEILRASLDRIRVRRFEQVAPTLHNIFVQQVGTEAQDA